MIHKTNSFNGLYLCSINRILLTKNPRASPIPVLCSGTFISYVQPTGIFGSLVAAQISLLLFFTSDLNLKNSDDCLCK